MKNIRLLILILIAVLSGCATTSQHNQPTWQLVYQHDNAGNPVAGDKARLVTLIKQGHPVRIHWALAPGFFTHCRCGLFNGDE